MKESKIIYFYDADRSKELADKIASFEKYGWEVAEHNLCAFGSGITPIICTSVLLQRDKEVAKRINRKKRGQ